MEKVNLLPCPFCGGKAVLEPHHRAFINSKTTLVSFVRCTRCNARSGRFELMAYGHKNHSLEAEEAAAEAWNKRVVVNV